MADSPEGVATSSDLSPVGRTMRGLGLAVTFVVSLVVVARMFVPPYPEDEILRAKLEHLEKHGDQYDGLFLGSSRIHRGFVPDEFERVTKAAGEPLRVFNFGLLYGRPHELDALLEELLKRHRFRYVFVEVMDWAPSINEDLADQERTIRWHTPRQTLSAIRTTWVAEGPWWRKVGRTGDHVGHCLKRAVNFGGGVPWLRSWFADDSRHRDWMEVIAEGHGFVPYERERDPLYQRERHLFLERYVDDYRRQVAGVDEQNARPGSLQHFNVRAQSEQVQRLRDGGAMPVHVVPNLRRGTPGWHRLAEQGVVETLFVYNRPGRFPELYAVENRFDRRHLNTDGAIAFTRLLANDFLEGRERRGASRERTTN